MLLPNRGTRRKQRLCLSHCVSIAQRPSTLRDLQRCGKVRQRIVVPCSLSIRGTLLHHGKGIESAQESTAEPVGLEAALGMVLMSHKGHLLLFVSGSRASGTRVCLPLRPIIFRKYYSTALRKTFRILLMTCYLGAK